MMISDAPRFYNRILRGMKKVIAWIFWIELEERDLRG
jgi:hypothetical protein